jgi:hypothetical protein
MRRNEFVAVRGIGPPPDRQRQTEAGCLPLSVHEHGAAARRRPTRHGYMLFEVQVAFLVLGIGLAGLCPLVVMQLRQVRQLEKRMQGDVTVTGASQPMVYLTETLPPTVLPTPYYYIVPWKSAWAQKLSCSAQIISALPGDPPPNVSPFEPLPLPIPSPAPTSYPVTVLSGTVFTTTADTVSYSVYVDVAAP